MITGYFRESDGGVLHDLQSAGARALEPFQIAAARVARPFGDAWAWFDGLVDAKSENERLRALIEEYRTKLNEARANPATPAELAARRYVTAPQLGDYEPLGADVLTDVFGYQQQVVVSVGSRDGVHLYDPVTTTRGNVLVGHVSKVGSTTSLVTLVTDRTSAVSAYIPARRARGSVRGRGPQHSTVYLDRVSKRAVVERGDEVVTAGRLSGERFVSFYPQGLSIGRVTTVYSSDTEQFKVVHVTPWADLADLERVVLLLRRKPLPALP